MIGLAGSQGPWISFLYFWSPINHQLHMPMHTAVKVVPKTTPVANAARPPLVSVTNKPPHAAMVSKMVRTWWPNQDCAKSLRRKIGNNANTSIEKSVNEKTCVVEGSREAKTVDAIMAEFVDIEVGNLHGALVFGRESG
jgi:hypothetical protein